MKLYNKELEVIENPKRRERIESIVKRQIEFLVQTYGIDEELLKERFEKLAVVEYSSEKDDGKYKIEFNGEIVEEQVPLCFAAFFTSKKVQYNLKNASLENAIYVEDKSFDCEIVHELFHYLSANTEAEFDNNGIARIKTGVKILGYNREDEVVDTTFAAEGLNEGITELLTLQMLDSTPRYEYQFYIANILNGNQDNSLIQAYFSKDCKAFESFLEEFDKRQSTVSSKTLIQLQGGSQTKVDTQLLRGCIEYTLSYCNTMEEFITEKNRLMPMFKRMTTNKNLKFDEEQFDIKTFVDGIFNKKEESIKNGKEEKKLLDSAIEATKEITRTGSIKIQVETLEDVVQGKNKKLKGTEKK